VLALGITALDAHSRFRDGGGMRYGLLAALGFLLALLGGGEYATALGGYVLAIELVRKGSLGSRIFGVLPFAIPEALYLAVRAKLGYGTSGSGFYVDPLHDPLAFLREAPWRGVALLIEGWLTYDVSTFVPGTARWIVTLTVVAAAAFLLRPVRRAILELPEGERRSATWLLVGSLVSMAPVLAVVPAMRVLGACVIGIAPVAAIVVEQAWFTDAKAEPSRAVQIGWYAALLLGFAHLVHGPGTAFLHARRHRTDGLEFQAHARRVRELVGDPSTADVVVVRGMAAASFFMPFALDPRGTPPARWCVLSHTGHVLVLRQGERSVELVTAKTSGLFPIGDGNLFRSLRAPLAANAVAETGCLRAQVLELGEHGPRSVRIDLRDDLARPVYVEEDFEDWNAAELPRVGFGAPFDP